MENNEKKVEGKIEIIEEVLLENVSGGGTHETCGSGGTEFCETVIKPGFDPV